MHCNNLPCEGNIFLYIFLLPRHLFCPSSYTHLTYIHIYIYKTRTCYNNNKNNHLYIPAAFIFSFSSSFISFFFAHINRISRVRLYAKNVYVGSADDIDFSKPCYVFVPACIYSIFMLAFVYLYVFVYMFLM